MAGERTMSLTSCMHRVLVIDDQSPVREALRLALEHMGFSVEEAENGEDGLRKARATVPNLILCDLDMPVMGGCETLEEMTMDPTLREVPVIVVSGMITRETESRVLRAGAKAILPKPFSLDALGKLVSGILSPGRDNSG
jgi:CheY-like chemotaxis protein